ncbi:MAG: Transposase [Pelotomaculum sp. PtaU1.Bin035]|nr:MAG: Transposase [Pelotomaculum sp. PtaU1.Bin035]
MAKKQDKKKGKRANGEGILRERNDGRWEARITTGRDLVTGKPIQKSFFGKSQAEAKKKRDDYLVSVATGTYVEPDRKKFGEWLNRYLTVFIKPKTKPASYANYVDLANNHINPVLGNIPLQKLDTDTIQDFYNKKAESGRLNYSYVRELPKEREVTFVSRKGSKLETTIKWLQEFLAKGPKDKQEIELEAKAKDIPLTTLRTAKERLGIISCKKQSKKNGKGGLSPRIIHMMHQIISGALKQAVKQKLILFNPADATTRPSLKYKEMTPLSTDEVNRYLDAARNDRLYPAFLLELTSGLRRGELLAPTWDCLDFTNETLTIKRTLARVRLVDKGTSELQFNEPKTEAGKRTIPLMPEVVQELKAHKARQAQEKLILGQGYKDNNLIFATPTGTPIEPRNFHRKHTEILQKAELRHIRLHDLRHTFASILLQEGENPENLRDLLGHSKTSTTMDLYCHSTMEGKKKAVSRLAGIIKA